MKRLSPLLLVLLIGCYHGPRVSDFPAAQQPHGIEVRVTLYGSNVTLRGELLAVEEDELVVALEDRIVSFTYERIASARFEQAPYLQIGAGRRPDATKRRDIRLLSRFPQGLEGDVLARLLDAYGQDEIEEAR